MVEIWRETSKGMGEETDKVVERGRETEGTEKRGERGGGKVNMVLNIHINRTAY